MKLDWTHEPDGDDNPFLEREEEGAVKVVAIDYVLDCHYTPGDPGCRYTRNGDGWPPTGPEVEFTAIATMLTLEDGSEREPTPEEAKTAQDWLENHGASIDRIYEAVCEEVAEAEYSARYDYDED